MSSRQLIDAYAIPEEQINSANVQLLQEGNSNPGANTAKLNSVDQMGSEPSIQSDIIPQFKKFSSNPSILKKTNSASGFGKYGDTKKSTLFNFENSNLITTAVDDEDEDEDSSVDIQFNSHKTTNPADPGKPERRVSSISFDFVGKSTDNLSMNSSINSQVYHIAFNLSGHMLYGVTNSTLSVLHKWIIASQLSSHGTQLQSISSNVVSSSVPGYRVRLVLKLLGLVVPIIVTVTAYFFQWTNLSSTVSTDACIPATYPSPSNVIGNFGNFLQGDTDFALVYSYGIPLEDGVIGGWSAWPLINPFSEFTLKGSGVGYVVGSQCFPAYSATVSSPGTTFQLSSLSQFENSVYGSVKVQTPKGSMILDDSNIDDIHGYIQECTFNIQFFEAETITSFQSDLWEMVAVKNVVSITVGGSTITTDTNKNRYTREFVRYTNTDKWNLASFYFPLVNLMLNSTIYYSSQGANFCNILQWATLPDGYYHDNIMWKGISAALASAAHYLVLQYDSTQTSSCNYYAKHGAGYLSSDTKLVILVQVLVAILGVGVLLHVWWIYLIHGLDISASIASHTLHSNVRFAHDSYRNGEQLFAGSVSTMDTFDEDILKRVGGNKVFYGTKFESMNDEAPQLMLGPKKSLISVKKLMRRRTTVSDIEKE
ncbi:hypothetical protein HDV04_004160 [Boothiomyces sp. JEL0838]|nr:hypothetical protein HDV04_004160 [Boothiomyces sp. JEL0838]